MRDPDRQLEGRFLRLPLLAFAPAMLAIAWTAVGGALPLVTLMLVILAAAAGNIYSMWSTGWAVGGNSRAEFMRGSDYSAFYWAQFCFFALVGVFCLGTLVYAVVAA